MRSRYSTRLRFSALCLLAATLVGCGGGGSSDDEDDNTTAAPPAANVAPTVSAGGDREANESSVVSITASASDSDGSIAGFQWSQLTGPAVTLANAATATVSFTTPAVTSDTPISLRVTVMDNGGASASDDVIVTIRNTPAGGGGPNLAPTANAGLDREAAESSTVSITGTGTDSDGVITGFQWSQTDGPPLTLTNAMTATVSFTAPAVSDDTPVTLRLVVTDDDGATGADDLVVMVHDVNGRSSFTPLELSGIVPACRALPAEAQPLCDVIAEVEDQLVDGCSTQLGQSPEFCATLGGHLHGVIEVCRANGGSTFCKAADAMLEGVASGCRKLPAAPPEFCALLGHERISEKDIVAFEQSWTHRALGLQYELGAALPFVDALFVATHNSFNSTSANSPQTLSGSDANQRYSTVDQLRMGVRAVEIDVHWMPRLDGGFGPTVCHGNAFHLGCTYEKSLQAELAEVRAWLDANDDQVVLIYLENNLNEPLDAPTAALIGTEPYAAAAAVIQGTLGDLVYRPADHAAFTGSAFSCSNGHPLAASVSSLRALGKRLYIQTEGCDAGWASWVFTNSGPNHDQGPDKDELETFSVNGVCGGFDRATHETKWTRFLEDGTLLGAFTSTSDGTLTAAPVFRGMVRCGVNMASMDHVTPSDPRLPAFVWSWAPGEPTLSATRNCALHQAEGLFAATSCAQSFAYACARRSNLDADAYLEQQWLVTAGTGSWSAGASACPQGYAFDVPRNGFDNELLKLAKTSAAVNQVWLNYNDATVDGVWR